MLENGIAAIENALCKEISIILNVDISLVKPGTLLASLGLDSMSFVELLVFIEKRFKIKLMESGLKKEDFIAVAPLAQRIKKELEISK